MDYLNIPIALCTYMLQKHIVKEIRLYIYLKTICSGHFKLSDEIINNCCISLGYKSVKTFKAHFEYLLQKKWLTFNRKSGNYRIIGFKQVANRLKFPTSKGVVFYPEYFKKFTSFVLAAVITYYMIYRSQKERRSALKKRGARMNRPSASYILPHTYLAKILKVSKTTAKRYRQYTIDENFLKTYKNYLTTSIPIAEVHCFKKYSDINSKIVRTVKNSVCLQQADKLVSSVTLRRKRNLRFVSKKFGKKWHR